MTREGSSFIAILQHLLAIVKFQSRTAAIRQPFDLEILIECRVDSLQTLILRVGDIETRRNNLRQRDDRGPRDSTLKKSLFKTVCDSTVDQNFSILSSQISRDKCWNLLDSQPSLDIGQFCILDTGDSHSKYFCSRGASRVAIILYGQQSQSVSPVSISITGL